MRDIFKSMLEHPIATVIVIGCLAREIATVISAAKGNAVQPVVSVQYTGKDD